jgi:hypothetical protein
VSSIEVRIRAPRARVYRALLDARELAAGIVSCWTA